jgi:hypothetical protein
MYVARINPIDLDGEILQPKRFIMDGISSEVDATYSLYIIL